MLAYRLKLPILEVEQMNSNQFIEWLAFFDIYNKSSNQQIRPNGKFS